MKREEDEFMAQATTVALSPRLLKSLEADFDLANHDEIIRFIHDRPSLAPLVLETRRVIRDIFDPASSLALEVFVDPDDIGDGQLFLVTRTSLPSADALARLDRVDKEWWLNRLDQANGDLTISVEHV